MNWNYGKLADAMKRKREEHNAVKLSATVVVGLDVEMTLEGAASGVDYIDVIQDKQGGNGKGKSELKGKG